MLLAIDHIDIFEESDFGFIGFIYCFSYLLFKNICNIDILQKANWIILYILSNFFIDFFIDYVLNFFSYHTEVTYLSVGYITRTELLELNQ